MIAIRRRLFQINRFTGDGEELPRLEEEYKNPRVAALRWFNIK